EAVGWGRRPMYNLTLRFEDGAIEGEGEDCIGAFTFHGFHDTQGHVSMVKQYLGKHRVEYVGTYDGEGTIFGTWFIPPVWTGPFALRLKAPPRGDAREAASEHVRETRLPPPLAKTAHRPFN